MKRLAILIGLVVVAVGGWFLLTPPPTSSRPAKTVARPSPAPAVAVPKAAAEPTPTAPDAPRPRPREKAKPAPADAPGEPSPAPPTTATLRVETDVEALVLIDRVGAGTAPITIANLTPGQHRLNVSAPPYDSYSETLDLAPGLRTVTIAFKEIKLDVKIAVVHKHGVGSCKGQLSASPAGIRYEAVDGKHSFSSPLAELGTFDVDYLAKNLRVATKQGTFNFTDPDGNADRLFTFHESVSKVRKRMQ